MKKAVLFLFIIFSSALRAQQADSSNWYMRASYNFGFIIQHHNSIGNLINGFVNGGEINYIKPTSGNKLCHYQNNFPEKGVGFTFFNLNNPTQLGNLYAIYGFYEIPLNKKAKPFRLYMRLAPGVAYTPVHFDAIENHKNSVISSPFNAYVNFKWYYRWDITSRLRWELGLNFSHSSNGRETVPNLGLNLIALNSGFVYKFKYEPKTMSSVVVDSSTKRPSKHELLVWAAVGVNQIDVLGKRYVAQGYSIAYYYNKRNTHKFGGGIDVYYNPANIPQLKSDSVTLSNNWQNIQVGVKFTYCYNIGRLSLPVEMGCYALSKFKDDGLFFHRIGMRYHFKNNFVAIFSLKTHWAVANYFEFGAGYRIPLKKKT